MSVAAYPPGTPVRVRAVDPEVHTRAPRYVRGQPGVIVEAHGDHRLPDAVVAGAPDVRPEPVYAVRFAARDLWGQGDHSVTVNLWHSYLEREGDG